MNSLNPITKARIIRSACRISMPSRTSICVLDMNSFELGTPGGGNLGFALDCRTEIELRLSEKVVFHSARNLDSSTLIEFQTLINHVILKWQEQTSTNENYEILYLAGSPQHVGLASSASIQMAVLAGLNWLHGVPYSEQDLRNFLISNYREAIGNSLQLGFTTGLSSFLNLYGGFAVVDQYQKVVSHIYVPRWNYVVAIPSNLRTRSFGDTEKTALMGDGRKFDTQDKNKKLEIVTNYLIPCLRNQTLVEIGKAIRLVQTIGSKQAEIAIYDSIIKDVIEKLDKEGVEVSFLSAVGPGIVLISERLPDEMKKIAKKCGLDIITSGRIDRTGAIISTLEQ